MSESDPSESVSVPTTPGDRLRAARDAQGLSIADIAQRTRIPQRHLDSIETGNYANLPSATYAVGFGKAYARAVGLDEVAIASDIRAEIAGSWDRPITPAPVYEDEHAGRTPPRGVVIGGVIVVLVLLLGLYLWYGTTSFRGSGLAPQAATTPGAEVVMPVPAPGTVAPNAAPQVTITANDEVWLRIYDAADTTLLMKTMGPGETFDVPANANNPMINVGRPDKLSISVNGAAVAPLGDGRRAIKDVPVSAAALLARGAPAPTASSTPEAAATASSTRSSGTATRSATAPRPTPTPAPTATRAPDPAPATPPPATGNGTDAP